jgi:hypothetical protein
MMEMDQNKDSKIDLEAKKESSNPYSTRILVNLSPVAYIKPGKGAPRGTSYNLQYEISKISYNIIDTKHKRYKDRLDIDERDTILRLRRLHVNTYDHILDC